MKRCLYCGKPLTGRKMRFCSDGCCNRYHYREKIKKFPKNLCKNCGKPTTHGNAKFCSTECRREYHGYAPEPMRRVKPKLCSPNEQPCWTCSKFDDGCSWSSKFIPIQGWIAEKSKTYGDGFKIISCPEYDDDGRNYT